MSIRGVDRRSVVQGAFYDLSWFWGDVDFFARAGMLQIDGQAIGSDSYESAPFFVVPFEMTDKTGLTEDMQKCLWSLYYVSCVVQQDALPAYMDDQGELKCIHQSKGKPVIVSSSSEDVEGGALPEIGIQLRIIRAVGVGNDDQVLNIVAVVSTSPMAFSLLHAVRASLMPSAEETREIDDRRVCWNFLRNHVRFGLNDHAVEDVAKTTVEGLSTDIDWMCLPGYFVEIFSIYSMVEWTRRLFFKRFPTAGAMNIEGFGAFDRDVSVLTDELHEQYVRQGFAIEKNIIKTLAKKKKAGRKRNSAGADGGGEDEESSEGQVPSVDEWALTSQDREFTEPWGSGFPTVEYAIRVSVPLSVSSMRTRRQFGDNIKSYPANISVVMLGAGVGVDVEADVQEDRDVITPEDAVRIINGQKIINDRPTLGGGDSRWARAYVGCIRRLPADQRLEQWRLFLRLGFALTATRANGSDRYCCSRNAAYAKYMESERESVEECGKVWGAVVESRAGCAMWGAARFMDSVLTTMNKCEWAFRSGNMALMWAILVTDVMLGLNYYNSSLEAAPNGIGPTIMVRDGGTVFRRLVRLFSGWSILHVYGKVNGSGVDTVVNVVKLITSLKEYIDQDRAGKDPWVTIGSSSEQGLRKRVCNVKEQEPGKDPVITHAVEEVGNRLIATEFPAQNTSSGLGCMQACSQLIRRNTISDTMTTYESTRETTKGQRCQVSCFCSAKNMRRHGVMFNIPRCSLHYIYI